MLNKYRVVAGAVAVAIALTSGGRLAGQVQPDDDVNKLWFVELQTSANTFRARAASSGIVYTERFAFNRLWNGLSVVASEREATRLGRVAGVRAVFPVVTFRVDPITDDTLQPEMKSAIEMTGAAAAQAGPDGATGAGIKVGVIDTGIDYDHPDLGGGFGAGFHVAYGYDFVGDRYDAATDGGTYQIPHPDADPDDCNGHGTHVAGIIGATGNAATGGVLGVAPGVTLGAYRVFGCDGSTSADIMIAAMERAYSDGMQVVNMSIGAAFQNWPQYPTAVAADELVARGVVVVASIGNSGASGVYSAGAPGVGRNVIGVASYDNTFIEMPYFETNDETKFGYGAASGGAPIPTSGSAPIVRTGTPSSAADACNTGTPPPPVFPQLQGKIALIRRGTCGFYEKSINAQNAGAIGVVLYNSQFGLLTPSVLPPAPGAPEVQIPVVMLTDFAGLALNNKIAAGATTLTWTDELDFFPNPTAGRASGFSSYGLDAELQLKPNIGAPGGRIRSTFPLEVQPYAVLSGTSMASPHVAGAVALYLEKHPTATPAQVKTALQNSADPVNFFSGAANTGLIDSVHKQGAGMLDIDDAILATTSITPSEISVGEGTAAKSFELTITNGSDTAVPYTVTHQSAIATAGTFQVSLFNNPATFSTPTAGFTLPPGGSQVVSVTITPPAAATTNQRVYGGYITITGDRIYRVPYAGFRGDYQTIQVLAPGGCEAVPFPAIFRQGGETICRAATPAIKLDVAYTPQAPGSTFNVEERSDRPVIFYHLAHQSRRLEIRAINEATNESYLLAAQDYMSRNAANGTTAATGSFSGYRWDGKYVATNGDRINRREAPAGTYRLQMIVTKANERGDTTVATETWTSPPLHITRTTTSTP